MFDKMKALLDMQKKMQELKKQLDETNFEAESQDKTVKITMNGSQEVKDVKIEGASNGLLESAVKDVLNKAIKRAQAIAAEKMKGITGLNLPGMM